MQKYRATKKKAKEHDETSSKTLKEIEKDKKTPESGKDSATPSPDGQLDERDKRNNAGAL